MYTIKTVATMTGINTETLRAWERRYAAVIPERDGQGRRRYSQEDVERLILLANATRQGFTIGKISGQSKVQLQALLAKNEVLPANNNEALFAGIMAALTEYQMGRCEELLKRALIAMEPLNYVCDVLLPSLQRVGQLWHDGKLSIAQEHMFTACVKRIILSMINNMQLSFSDNTPRIIFATLSGENHEFGILLSSLLAVSQRCNCFYIGTDLPWQELLIASEKIQPAIITLSIVNYPPWTNVIGDLTSLANELPRNIQLWIGGSGADFLFEQQQLPERYIYTSSLNDFNARINRVIRVP
ncbi:MerR family transcriptional regulator [Methyloprofundus sedimenti]|uniref:MerR family transcriptional regulator n=1 Tax=Methyloprofundus sedimenti TaxID=1420851 RepID=A0A1V8M389_9GAMM|nr:MerR family transcriptional regulator [Methyloprofundus sedimenti]OQK16027.1 MerR family transcriptional regulator [Methyloprofundus sedimenti]